MNDLLTHAACGATPLQPICKNAVFLFVGYDEYILLLLSLDLQYFEHQGPDEQDNAAGDDGPLCVRHILLYSSPICTGHEAQ